MNGASRVLVYFRIDCAVSRVESLCVCSQPFAWAAREFLRATEYPKNLGAGAPSMQSQAREYVGRQSPREARAVPLHVGNGRRRHQLGARLAVHVDELREVELDPALVGGLLGALLAKAPADRPRMRRDPATLTALITQ